MIINSPAFETNGPIPPRYTCDGINVNPPLEFFEVPADAKFLALIMEDPDASVGVWTHWTLWNIDSKFEGVGEGNIPQGSVEGMTSTGNVGYSGPCPPTGSHRYFFYLYGLPGPLDIPVETLPYKLKEILERTAVEKAETMVIYQRKNEESL